MQGLLLAGVIAGPHALGLVRNAHQIELLAEIGVVPLLFVIGLEISVADLERLKHCFAIGGSVQFFATAAAVVALSSTAIVLRMLQDRGELDTPHGRSIPIFQDIGVRVLARMLVPRERIQRLIGEVRADWRQMARSLATFSIPPRVGQPWVGQTIAQSRLRDAHRVVVPCCCRRGRCCL